MAKLRITEAMAHYTLKTGEEMKRRDLAAKIWPTGSDKSRPINIRALMNGKTKRIDIDAVDKICKATQTDPNFLFGWKETM